MRRKPASSKGVSSISRKTTAGSSMIYNSTLCIYTTQTRTWVNTFHVLTCFVRRTFRVGSTFRSACNIWIAKVLRNTLASSCSVSVRTNCIGSTGSRVAGINNFSRCCLSGDSLTCHKSISKISRVTFACWEMIGYMTRCKSSTNSWTRVHTMLV